MASKIQQHNAAVSQVWQSLRYEGDVRGSNGTQEYFTCASASQPGTRYTITHDLTNDRYHCTCVAGTYSRDCKHQQATRRYVAERAANMAKQAEMAARMQAEAQERDSAPLRSAYRSNRAFSLLK